MNTDTPTTKTPTTPIVIGAAAVAALALVLAVLALARTPGQAEAASAEDRWTCTAEAFRVAPAEDGLERETEKVVSALAHAASGTPLRVETAPVGEEADLIVETYAEGGYEVVDGRTPTVHVGSLASTGHMSMALQGYVPCDPTEDTEEE